MYAPAHTCQPSRKTDLVSCYPGNIQNCPRKLFTWQVHSIKYKSDRDRMLVGSGSLPATGWMPVC